MFPPTDNAIPPNSLVHAANALPWACQALTHLELKNHISSFKKPALLIQSLLFQLSFENCTQKCRCLLRSWLCSPHPGAMNPIDSVGEGGGLVGWGRRPKSQRRTKTVFSPNCILPHSSGSAFISKYVINGNWGYTSPLVDIWKCAGHFWLSQWLRDSRAFDGGE